jgi:hypothetical protein
MFSRGEKESGRERDDEVEKKSTSASLSAVFRMQRAGTREGAGLDI